MERTQLATAFEVVADLLEQRVGERLLEKAEEAARAVEISEEDLAAAIVQAANALIERAPAYARVAKQLAATRAPRASLPLQDDALPLATVLSSSRPPPADESDE